MRKYTAEMIGTFCLVFAGTGAVVINDVQGGVISHVGIALTFGLVVMAMIYAIGDVSGAHINPAVTIAFWAARRFEGKMVLPYIACQCAGAILASLLLLTLFPNHETLGTTLPTGIWKQAIWQPFVLEVVLTFMLMFVILNVSTGAQEKGIMAGTAIGAVVAFEAMFAGPLTGASMNPARSLGPALVSGNLTHLWLYIAAPILGALLSVGGCRCIQKEGCCGGEDQDAAC